MLPTLDTATKERLDQINEQIKDLYREIRTVAPTFSVADLAAAIEADEDAVHDTTIEIQTETGMQIVGWATPDGDGYYRVFGYDDGGEEITLGFFPSDAVLYRTA